MTNYLICHIWQDEIKKGAATWLKILVKSCSDWLPQADDDLGEVPERGYTTLTPTSAKEEASEEPVEKNKDAETESEKAASQTQEDDSEESAPASEEI